MFKNFYKSLIVIAAMFLGSFPTLAQTSVTTGLPNSVSSGSGANYYLTFIIENTNGSPITITDIQMYRSSGANGNTFSLYYSPTSLSGGPGVTPPATPTAPTWVPVTSAVLSAVTTTAIHPTFTNLTLNIPANTAYRFLVQTNGSTLNYGGSANTPNSFTNGGVYIRNGNYQINGLNVGYWGPSTNPRAWCGTVTFVPAGPCVSPPIPGTAQVNNSSPCFGQSIGLSVTGNSFGTGQTFQWQEGNSPTGPWNNISTSSPASTFTYTPASSGTKYYRVAITCGASTTYSVPVSVVIPTAFAGGTYTINPALPASSTNFQSFSAAVSAISCGITGHVIFNVAPGTYNEQINIPVTVNSNSGRTVTFNGNGAILAFNQTSSAGSFATMNLDGVNHFTFNNLKFQANGASYGFAVHMMNEADSNSFNNCEFKIPITATSSNCIALCLSGSTTSYSVTGDHGSDNSFDSCLFEGGYFTISSYGAAGTNMNNNNSFTNCEIRDFYVYATYFYYSYNTKFLDGIIHRPTRSSVTTTYGLMFTTGCEGIDAQRNKIYNLFAAAPNASTSTYCIYVGSDGTATNRNRIINNAIYDIDNGSSTYGLYLTGADYIDVQHNTIILDNQSATAGTVYGIYATGTIANATNMRNNIIYITHGGSGTKYGIYANSNTLYPKVINYNNIYINTTATTYVGYNGTNYATLASWQTGSGYDVNSVELNPQFVNGFIPTNLLMSYKGIGIPTVPTDIFDSVRNPSTPDIGAVEYTEPPVCGTVTLPFMLTAQADRDTTCTNGIINLSVLQAIPVSSSINYRWEYKTNATSNWLDFGTPLQTTSNYQVLGAPEGRWYRAAVFCDSLPVLYSDSVYVETVTPNIDISSDVIPGTICSGTPINFSSSNENAGNAPIYQWQVNGVNVGVNNGSYSQASWTGNAQVRAIITGDPSHFCAGFKDTSNVLQFFVVPTVTPDIAINSNLPNNATCNNASVHFTTVALNQGLNPVYNWQVNGVSVGNNNPDLYISTLTNGDVVRCILTSDALCKTKNIDTSNDVVMNIYNPAPASIVKTGNVLSTTIPYVSYQWIFNNGLIAGATNPTYTATQVGNYWARVVDANGCTTESNIIWVPFVMGITELGKNAQVKLYPNPASDKVRIDSKTEVLVRVWNGIGQMVLETTSIKEVDVQNWSNGTYLFEISNLKGEVLMRERILKNN